MFSLSALKLCPHRLGVQFPFRGDAVTALQLCSGAFCRDRPSCSNNSQSYGQRMDNIKNPIVYSAMTQVAYSINVKYYGGLHYMWCTPYFGADYKSPHFTVPPSSSPLEIYSTLENEVIGGDLHGDKINLNRMGIRKGADHMLAEGRITAEEHSDIHAGNFYNHRPTPQWRCEHDQDRRTSSR